jgi:hypothetical protein
LFDETKSIKVDLILYNSKAKEKMIIFGYTIFFSDGGIL